MSKWFGVILVNTDSELSDLLYGSVIVQADNMELAEKWVATNLIADLPNVVIGKVWYYTELEKAPWGWLEKGG